MAQEDREAWQLSDGSEQGGSEMTADLGIRRVCPPRPWVVLGNSHPSHTRQEGTLGWEVSPRISVLPGTSFVNLFGNRAIADTVS